MSKRGSHGKRSRSGSVALLLFVTILFCLCTVSVFGLQIRDYTPSRHDRFVSGYPEDPQENPDFWQAAHDFSGVGWDTARSDRSVTLVSPRHFIAARHFRPGIGATLAFLSRDGVMQSNTVEAYYITTNDLGEASDVILGELNTSFTADQAVSYYAIANLGTESEYIGFDVLMYGKTARVGAGVVDGFTDIVSETTINSTRGFEMRYAKVGGGLNVDDAYVESGDSGSPSFLLISNRLTFVGTHATIESTTTAYITGDVFVPRYVDQLNASSREAGYQLALWPPPASESRFTDLTLDGTNVVAEWTATNFVNYTLLYTTNDLRGPVTWHDVAPTNRPGPQASPFLMKGTNQTDSLSGFRAFCIRVEVPEATGF